jgi:hypothetical protein
VSGWAELHPKCNITREGGVGVPDLVQQDLFAASRCVCRAEKQLQAGEARCLRGQGPGSPLLGHWRHQLVATCWNITSEDGVNEDMATARRSGAVIASILRLLSRPTAYSVPRVLVLVGRQGRPLLFGLSQTWQHGCVDEVLSLSTSTLEECRDFFFFCFHD